LEVCLAGLSEQNRELIRMRYLEGLEVEDVAKLVDRPAKTVYRILQQVRTWLHGCIQHRIARQPSP
jgi:RNA polymerase sigma factor (sigma-70 family)